MFRRTPRAVNFCPHPCQENFIFLAQGEAPRVRFCAKQRKKSFRKKRRERNANKSFMQNWKFYSFYRSESPSNVLLRIANSYFAVVKQRNIPAKILQILSLLIMPRTRNRVFSEKLQANVNPLALCCVLTLSHNSNQYSESFYSQRASSKHNITLTAT